MTTIVLKLAAVGYSAAAFPCKAFPDETQTEKSSRGCRRPLRILIAPQLHLAVGPSYLPIPSLPSLSLFSALRPRHLPPLCSGSCNGSSPSSASTFYLIVHPAYPCPPVHDSHILITNGREAVPPTPRPYTSPFEPQSPSSRGIEKSSGLAGN